ncbi:MAG TPA: SLBB domain-containing protein [Candidatus Eisenbacteria bacterium]|nr:SLBB domain-containing protein [Candidatus Eisenbacteria bacterium]
MDPTTYRIGPGDELAIRYSDLLDPKILRVAPSGELLLPDVGTFQVAGLTLAETQVRLREALKPYIKGKGFVLALNRPRRFRMPVLGDVASPGSVTLQAPVRASEAIAAAGGITGTGARRGIELRRTSDTLFVDLIRYTRAGDVASNPLVFETDVIYVPSVRGRIEVLGAVPHPGLYDYVPGDHVSTAIALGGGTLANAALESAELAHVRADGTRSVEKVAVAAAMASPGSPADPPLEEGDRIFIPSRSHWLEGAHVEVEGEVARPGPYPITDGVDRIRSVLERAGGFTEQADRPAVRVERMVKDEEPDSVFLRIALSQEDLLAASDRAYVVAKTRERQALSAHVGVLLEAGDARGDLPLRDLDRIVVPKRVPYVSVQGEVRSPGYVPYREGWKVDDYVKAAGGTTSRAYKSRTRVTLSLTGRPVAAEDAGPLRPGDSVLIPTKPDRNPWGTIRDLIGVVAAASAIVIAVEAVNQ